MRENDQSLLTSAATSKAARTAWLVVALLWPVALLNYLVGSPGTELEFAL